MSRRDSKRPRDRPARRFISHSLLQALQRAAASCNAGRFAEAERLCEAILAAKPDLFDALHLSGLIAAQQNRLAQAHQNLSRAVAINPNSAEAWSNLANVLKMLGRINEALSACDRALAIKPDLVAAFNTRGIALKSLGRFDEALASYDRALTIKPNYPEALNNRATALMGLQRYEAAVACLDRAVAINPCYVDAHCNRGFALQHLKRFEDALASVERALATQPDHIEALNLRAATLAAVNRHEEALATVEHALVLDSHKAETHHHRGRIFRNLGRLEEALASVDRALALAPDAADVLNSRGVMLKELARYAEALASFERALALQPDIADGWNNRGIVLIELKRVDDAVASYDRALALMPNHVEALTNRSAARFALERYGEALADLNRALDINPDFARALQQRAMVLAHLGRHEEACKDLERALDFDPELSFANEALLYSRMHCCNWTSYGETRARVIADVRHGKRFGGPFWFLAISHSPEDQLRGAQSWVREQCPPSANPLWNGERYRHERIRIAYLSADLREHPIARNLIGLLEAHDRTRIETIGVSYGPIASGPMRSRARAAFETFLDVRDMSDFDVAKRLRELEVDIAVDLNGFTTYCRTGICALRPAPIQVNYLGYPATMGASYIDYIIADDLVIPPAERGFFTEKIALLPDTYFPHDSKQQIAGRTPTRREVGLPETRFVFCCFNATYKITPQMFDVWMRLLKRVEDSVLWLRVDDVTARVNLCREAAQRGIAPARLVFASQAAHADHLARHRLADLFLDTLPYNAHTTASDALWAGLPVVTCTGTTFAGRVAASLLRAVGLPELITTSLDTYEALAFRLATDADLLARLKNQLSIQRDAAALFDTDRFRQHLESAYSHIWERYQRGEGPESFAVAPIATRPAR